jgi:hypothetical protein
VERRRNLWQGLVVQYHVPSSKDAHSGPCFEGLTRDSRVLPSIGGLPPTLVETEQIV